jgi:ABC-2 type transport system permease protein
VTSIGYQFRGWLASLMMNKRRRRTIMTIAGLFFVLIVQLPNILTQPWRARQRTERRMGRNPDFRLEDIQNAATTINLAAPLGWLPYGAMTSAEGRVMPAILGALGLSLIAAASLRRSYVTTLRLYRGDFGNTPRGGVQSKVKLVSESAALSAGPVFLERQLPWMSEQASAVALACFRSLCRAPEARIMFLSPVIVGFVFGSMMLRGGASPPELLRPLMATGGIGMVLLILGQLAGNQFGFDRNGFRSYVLSPAERRDVLIGKNIALAPFALGMTWIVVAIFQYAYPMRFDHFVATLVQTIPMYFLFCLIENVLSMLAPMPVAPGSLKPAKPKGIQVLIHLLFFFMFPLALSPTLIPLGMEFLLNWLGSSSWFPAYLVFILLECVAMVAVYPAVIDWQGGILEQRERRILEVVTSKTE